MVVGVLAWMGSYDLNCTHSLVSFYWSGVSSQWTLLLTENCLQYQKWYPYRERGVVSRPVCAKKLSSQCWLYLQVQSQRHSLDVAVPNWVDYKCDNLHVGWALCNDASNPDSGAHNHVDALGYFTYQAERFVDQVNMKTDVGTACQKVHKQTRI